MVLVTLESFVQIVIKDKDLEGEGSCQKLCRAQFGITTQSEVKGCA